MAGAGSLVGLLGGLCYGLVRHKGDLLLLSLAGLLVGLVVSGFGSGLSLCIKGLRRRPPG